MSAGVDTGAWTERRCAALHDQHFCVIRYMYGRYVKIKVPCLNKINEHNTRRSSLFMFHFERLVIEFCDIFHSFWQRFSSSHLF